MQKFTIPSRSFDTEEKVERLAASLKQERNLLSCRLQFLAQLECGVPNKGKTVDGHAKLHIYKLSEEALLVEDLHQLLLTKTQEGRFSTSCT